MTDGELLWNVRALPARSVLALTLWGECRGEPYEGQVAVACVVRNRVEQRIKTYQAVCLQPWQFSCWYAKGPNRSSLFVHAEAVLAGVSSNDVIWLSCLQIANDVIQGRIRDIVDGAANYLTTQLYESPECPGWAKRGVPTVTIGHHIFLRDC